MDILVVLEDPAVGRMADLTGRLTQQLGREAQLIRLEDAEASPILMRAILEKGRTLIDREGRWSTLRADTQKWQRRARSVEHPLADATKSLDLDQKSAPR